MSDLVPGMYWGERHERAPEFVKGRVSFHLERFLDWARTQEPNEKGYLNCQLLEKKDGGGCYFKLDTYKPQSKEQPRSQAAQAYANKSSEPFDDSIPFVSHERGWLV